MLAGTGGRGSHSAGAPTLLPLMLQRLGGGAGLGELVDGVGDSAQAFHPVGIPGRCTSILGAVLRQRLRGCGAFGGGHPSHHHERRLRIQGAASATTPATRVSRNARPLSAFALRGLRTLGEYRGHLGGRGRVTVSSRLSADPPPSTHPPSRDLPHAPHTRQPAWPRCPRTKPSLGFSNPSEEGSGEDPPEAPWRRARHDGTVVVQVAASADRLEKAPVALGETTGPFYSAPHLVSRAPAGACALKPRAYHALRQPHSSERADSPASYTRRTPFCFWRTAEAKTPTPTSVRATVVRSSSSVEDRDNRQQTPLTTELPP
jgi:hypothetical protein